MTTCLETQQTRKPVASPNRSQYYPSVSPTLPIPSPLEQAVADGISKMSISHIPTEILTEIFIFLKPPTEDPPKPNPNHFPLVLGRVCRHWRAVSEQTGNLWTGARLTVNQCTSKHDGLARTQEWLARAGDLPLSIQLVSRPTAPSREEAADLARYIIPLLTNVKHLVCGLPEAYVHALSSAPEVIFPMLETFMLTMSPADMEDAHPDVSLPLYGSPRLHSVHLITPVSRANVGIVTRGLARSVPWPRLRRLGLTESNIDQARVCEIFHQSINLEECLITVTNWADINNGLAWDIISTPHARLRSLKVCFPTFPADIFRSVSLPALKYLELEVTEDDGPISLLIPRSLLELQRNSRFPLTMLRLCNVPFSPGQTYSLLSSLPTLTSLYLALCSFLLVPSSVLALTHSPDSPDPPLCPNLTNLQIWDSPLTNNIKDDLILDMLESRWRSPGSEEPPVGIARLQTVVIDAYPDGTEKSPPRSPPSESSFQRSKILINAGMELLFRRMIREE